MATRVTGQDGGEANFLTGWVHEGATVNLWQRPDLVAIGCEGGSGRYKVEVRPGFQMQGQAGFGVFGSAVVGSFVDGEGDNLFSFFASNTRIRPLVGGESIQMFGAQPTGMPGDAGNLVLLDGLPPRKNGGNASASIVRILGDPANNDTWDFAYTAADNGFRLLAFKFQQGPGEDFLFEAANGNGVDQKGGDIIFEPGRSTGIGAEGVFRVDDPDGNPHLTLGYDGANPVTGFFGQAGTARPTIVGATGANAALQALLTALEAMGLIIDNTT